VVRCWRGYLSGLRYRLAYAQLMPLPLTVSCFSKIQIGFIFLVLAHRGSPGKGPLNWCVYVCVCDSVCVCACVCVLPTPSLRSACACTCGQLAVLFVGVGESTGARASVPRDFRLRNAEHAARERDVATLLHGHVADTRQPLVDRRRNCRHRHAPL